MQASQENPAGLSDVRRMLVVMAKAPRPGSVKTRLTQSLPVEAVTELYRCPIARHNRARGITEQLGGSCRHVSRRGMLKNWRSWSAMSCAEG